MRNFIDDLITSFELNEHVTDASFGYVFNKNTNLQHLFLALGLSGDEEKVKSMTWFIKSKYLPDSVLNFASSLSDDGIYSFVKSGNFTFYEKGSAKVIEPMLLQYFLQPEVYKEQLLETIKKVKLMTLFKDISMDSSTLNFQTYIRDSGEFIPLFTDQEMILKTGMSVIPENLTVMTFDFNQLNSLVNENLTNRLYILNPGSQFEFQFIG